MKRFWICTFGVGHPLAGYVIKVNALHEENARAFMVTFFNGKWCSTIEGDEGLDYACKYKLQVIEADAEESLNEG